MSHPWSNFLSAIIWSVTTASHWQVQMTLRLGRSWLSDAGLAPSQVPVCPVLAVHWGGEDCWANWPLRGVITPSVIFGKKLPVCSTTEKSLRGLILLGQEMATLRWETFENAHNGFKSYERKAGNYQTQWNKPIKRDVRVFLLHNQLWHVLFCIT